MNMVRAAIERLYKGLCSVKVKVSSVNEETGETVFTEKAVLTEQPCRLSFQSRNSAAKDDGYNTDYCRSGESAVYTSHQEIALELFEDYA